MISYDEQVREDVQVQAGARTHIEITFRIRVTIALAQRGFESFHPGERPDPLPVSFTHSRPLIQYCVPIPEIFNVERPVVRLLCEVLHISLVAVASCDPQQRSMRERRMISIRGVVI